MTADNPTVSGEAQSTSMESLNDELTPKTDKPHQELESGNNIQHEIGGFKKFLTTSAQVIRLHCMPIIFSSIVCFVFNSDIAEISLATRNLLALFCNSVAILLMFKLIKGESPIVKMECEVKSESAEMEDLKTNCNIELNALNEKLKTSGREIDRYKKESEATKFRMTQMENELKSNTREIQYLQKMEGEWKSRISQLQKEVNTANCKVRDNSKMAEDVQRILETVEDNSSYLRVNDSRQLECESEKKSLIRKMEDAAKLKDQEMENLKVDTLQSELEAKGAEFDKHKLASEFEKKSLMAEMESESKKKLEEIELLKLTHQKTVLEKESLITKMDCEAKLKDQEMENLKIAHAKTETEWKSAKVHLEREIKSKAKEIDNLERKSKHEFDDLNEKLEASRKEIDRCKRESDEKITDMENKIKLKTNEIEYLQKSEGELKTRISQLEDEVNAANCKIGENLKMSGDVQRTLEKVETNSRDNFEKMEKNLRSLLDRTSGNTIRARFTNIRSLTIESEYSNWTEFAGMNWRIHVWNPNGDLLIFLRGEKSTRWSGTVSAEFKLMSQNGYRCVKSLEKTDKVSDLWGLGYYKLMSYEDLLKSDAVWDDGSILVEVVIRVVPAN